jgi:hypothetical protein
VNVIFLFFLSPLALKIPKKEPILLNWWRITFALSPIPIEFYTCQVTRRFERVFWLNGRCHQQLYSVATKRENIWQKSKSTDDPGFKVEEHLFIILLLSHLSLFALLLCRNLQSLASGIKRHDSSVFRVTNCSSVVPKSAPLQNKMKSVSCIFYI